MATQQHVPSLPHHPDERSGLLEGSPPTMAPSRDTRPIVVGCGDNEEAPTEEPFLYLKETLDLITLSLPIGTSYFFLLIVPFICTAFVGTRKGVTELQGFGLAAMIVDFLGFAPITGLACGLDTLIPQAYGITPRHPMICVFVQRAFLFLLVYCVPVALLFWFSEPMLLYFGTGTPEVVSIAAKNLRVMILLLPSWVASEVLQCYLNGLGKTVEVFTGTAVGAVCCPIILYLFVNCDWVGFYGGSSAWVIVQLIIPLTTYILARYNNGFDETWFGWSRRAFTDWWHFLRLALPALGMMLCEWSAFEINGIAASRFLGPKAFAATVVLNRVYVMSYAIPVGTMVAGSIRVGHFVGRGDAKSAQKIMLLGSCGYVALLLGTIGLVLYLWEWISGLFTHNAEVLTIYNHILLAGMIFYFFDMSFSFNCSILRALGLQFNGAVATFVAWWMIGIPAGWFYCSMHMNGKEHTLANQDEQQARWLYYGPALGMLFGCIITTVYLCRTSWKQTSDVYEALNDLIETD